MPDRALVVLDQVSCSALDHELGLRGLPLSHPVMLDYVPRTTPVGHATISTGVPPSTHRVQGRTWYEHGPLSLLKHEIGHAVTHRRPVPPDPLHVIGASNLAGRLRGDGMASIVAVAAKDFIPFLFGAWDCDVVVYPFDVMPGRLPGGGLGLSIVFVAWTSAGHGALSGAWPAIAAQLAAMAPVGATTSTPAPAALTSLPHVHVATWQLPASWGTAKLSYAPHWRTYLMASANMLDDGYTDIAQRLLARLPQPRAHLQSCFSTDAYGHASGPGMPDHVGSVARGVARALRLAGKGYKVGVTSDHGGRLTPNVAAYDPAAATIAGTALPVGHHYKDGDHVVGYSFAPGRAPSGPPRFWVSTPAGLAPFTVPSHMTVRSYHAQQRPAWKVSGDLSTRVAGLASRGGGGDHGLCETGGFVAAIDNEVPAWSPNATSSHLPGRLDDVADWFLGLT